MTEGAPTRGMDAHGVLESIRAAVRPAAEQTRDALKKRYLGYEFIRWSIFLLVAVGVWWLCAGEVSEWITKWPEMVEQVNRNRQTSENLLVNYCKSNTATDKDRLMRAKEDVCIAAEARVKKFVFLEAVNLLFWDELHTHTGPFASAVEWCCSSFFCQHAIFRWFFDDVLAGWAKNYVFPVVLMLVAGFFAVIAKCIYGKIPKLRRTAGSLPTIGTKDD